MSTSPPPSPSSSYDHLPTPSPSSVYAHLPPPSPFSSYAHLPPPSPSSSYDHLPTPPSDPPVLDLDPSSSTASLPSPPSPRADSLPSSDSSSHLSSSSTTSAGGSTDAEREWQESLQQLELLLTMVVVPFAGKYLGRRCAYWGWTRFMEWKYPVEVVVTSKPRFRAVGIIEAASPL